jgi:hypothetical protein
MVYNSLDMEQQPHKLPPKVFKKPAHVHHTTTTTYPLASTYLLPPLKSMASLNKTHSALFQAFIQDTKVIARRKQTVPPPPLPMTMTSSFSSGLVSGRSGLDAGSVSQVMSKKGGGYLKSSVSDPFRGIENIDINYDKARNSKKKKRTVMTAAVVTTNMTRHRVRIDNKFDSRFLA